MTRKQLLNLRDDAIVLMGIVVSFLATDPTAVAWLTQHGPYAVMAVGLAFKVHTYFKNKPKGE